MQVEVMPQPCFNLHTLKVSSAVNPDYGMESNAENKIVFSVSRFKNTKQDPSTSKNALSI